MTKLTLSQLSNDLFRACDDLRGNMDASEYEDIGYSGRFAVWLPEKGKKADLMFVQHTLAALRGDGNKVVCNGIGQERLAEHQGSGADHGRSIRFEGNARS